jgi:hypothetical protein
VKWATTFLDRLNMVLAAALLFTCCWKFGIDQFVIMTVTIAACAFFDRSRPSGEEIEP